MLNTLKKLFGIGPGINYAELVKEGAIILDVRSKGEFAGGHIKGAVNISVDSWPRGIYFVMIINGGSIVTRKIILQ